MPPPVSYIDVTTLPFEATVTPAAFNVNGEQWFRAVLSARTVLGIYTSGAGMTPTTRFYESDGETLIDSPVPGTVGMYKVLAIGTYYIQILSSPASIPNDITTSFDAAPIWTGPVTPGYTVINDDSDGFPAAVIDGSGTIVGYILDAPAGEMGDVLPTGISLWHHSGSGGPLSLLDASFQLITTVSVPGIAAGHPFPLITNDGTQFYVLNRATGAIYTVSNTGTVSGVLATLPAPVEGYSSLGVTEDGSIAYWTDAIGFPGAPVGGSPSIHRHDLLTDSPLSDLYTVPDLLTDTGYLAITGINHHPGDLKVLGDGSVVTWYANETDGTNVIIHVSSGGTLLDAKTYTGEFVDHIARTGSDLAIRIWIYTDGTGEEARIGTLALASGSETSSPFTLFSQGVNPSGEEKFGISSSCTLVTASFSTTPVPPVVVTPDDCCETPTTGTVPDPIEDEPLTFLEYACEGGGLVEQVADLPGLEACWQ